MVKRGLLTREDALGSAVTSHDEAQRLVEIVIDRLLKDSSQASRSTRTVGSVDLLGEVEPRIVQIREKARDYLKPQPLHESERVAAELRAMCKRTIPSAGPDLLQKLLSSDMYSRVVGYFMFQVGPTAQAIEPLFSALETERLLAAQTGETRPLWQLLVCFTQVMTEGRLSENVRARDLETLRTLAEFLKANPSIDPGRECRTRLEAVQALAGVMILAQEYKSIRRTQTAGNVRTRNMTELVHRMRPAVRQLPSEYLLPMLADGDRGRRLCGYVYLYEVPLAETLQDLVDSLTRIENTPFGQYWALMALSRVLPKVSPHDVPDDTVRRLRTMRDNLKPGIDRRELLSHILATTIDKQSEDAGLSE